MITQDPADRIPLHLETEWWIFSALSYCVTSQRRGNDSIDKTRTKDQVTGRHLLQELSAPTNLDPWVCIALPNFPPWERRACPMLLPPSEIFIFRSLVFNPSCPREGWWWLSSSALFLLALTSPVLLSTDFWLVWDTTFGPNLPYLMLSMMMVVLSCPFLSESCPVDCLLDLLLSIDDDLFVLSLDFWASVFTVFFWLALGTTSRPLHFMKAFRCLHFECNLGRGDRKVAVVSMFMRLKICLCCPSTKMNSCLPPSMLSLKSFRSVDLPSLNSLIEVNYAISKGRQPFARFWVCCLKGEELFAQQSSRGKKEGLDLPASF